jgi:serine/threonine-protein kinase
VDGETLEERIAGIATRRLEARDVVKIGVAVAGALRHAYETQRIVHYNIKPSNIFLSKKGEVKLGDFGLAVSLDPSETSADALEGAPWGTLHYMSPEQLERSKLVDARTDIYSLGATLYHAVTGVRPFEAASVQETMALIREGTIEPADKVAGAKHCPRGLAALIARAMDRDRARRFANAAEMQAALQALGG